MKQTGYQAYKAQSINTMTQGELLLLLYAELQKRLSRAEIALKDKEYSVFDQSMKRCQEIVHYLVDTLDFQYPISLELNRMYSFFQLQISRIRAGRNAAYIADLKSLVQELEDAFTQLEKGTNG